MATVPAVPKERQQRAIDSLAVANSAPHNRELRQRCFDRLVAGTERYGLSWNEVDLKTDICEELEDAINYTALIIGRLIRTGTLTQRLADLIFQIREDLEQAWVLIQTLPDFEGPTSNEWVTQRNG